MKQKFLSKAVREGHESYLLGLASSENPYKQTLRDHLDWNTGWWIAKTQYSTDIEHISLDFAKKQGSENSIDYYYWLDSLDKRAKEILLSLDEEIPVGNWKANQKYIGELEGRLLTAAKDHTDFINLYQSVFSRNNPDHVATYNEACKIWNIAATLANHRMETIIRSLTSSHETNSENRKNENR